MLLSRVADALYWISRYLERAEHTARLMDVAADLRLGRAATTGSVGLERLYASLGLKIADGDDPVGLVDGLFDASNRRSIASCVSAARENARQVREEISSEMWEQINALYLRARVVRDDAGLAGRTHFVARSIIEGVHLFCGITDATMSHGEGWQYLQAGRFLERAEGTSLLVDRFLGDDRERGRMPLPLDQADLVALLQSCSAVEGYCRRYTADVRQERVVEFLLLDPEFPRSIRFSATRIEGALRAVARHGGRSGGRAERLSGRLRASLDYAQVDEILSDGARDHLRDISTQCAEIHDAVYQSYIAYSIDSALRA